jgi:hypothetical protein
MRYLITFLASIAFFFPGILNAQTIIRIVGSTGDIRAVQSAIADILSPGWTFQGTLGNTNSSGSQDIARYSTFGAWSGYFNGSPVVIKTTFIGGAGAIRYVAGLENVSWVASNGTGTGSIPPLDQTQYFTPTPNYELVPADFGFATVFQYSTPFYGLFNGVSYQYSIPLEQVSVEPIVFVASAGFPATNITTHQASLLYSAGSLPLSLFTGNYTNGDQNKTVWALGRNVFSGERIGVISQIGLGISSNNAVYLPALTGQTFSGFVSYGGSVTSHELWPANEIGGQFSPLGNGGFSAGYLLARALTSTLGPDAYRGKYEDPENPGVPIYQYPNATAGYYIGYLSSDEASKYALDSAIPAANRGVLLKYNGVDYTENNVRNGLYPLWLYNNIIRISVNNFPAGSVKANFFSGLRDRIKTVTGAYGGILNDSNFKVQRFNDGGYVVPK